MHTACRTLLLTTFCCAVFLSAHAQPVHELTPEESVRLGLERNLRLRAAHAEAAGAEAAHRMARAGRLPTVRSRADYTRLSGNIPEVEFTLPGIDTTFTILPVELDRYHSEVSVEQPLFAGFRVRNRIQAAAHEAEAAVLSVRQEEADVAFEIRRMYWGLYEAMAVREMLDAALGQVDAHLRDVQARVEEGTALRGDLLAARTRRSEVLLERLEAENAVRVSQLELSRLIGLPLESRVEPVAAVEVGPLRADWPELAGQAVQNRPQIRALAERVEALRLQIDVSRGAWLPEVALIGRYVFSRPNPYFFTEQDQFRGTGEVRVALQWNLFEGGRRSAQTARARAELQAAEALLSDAREQVAVEVARRQLEVRRAAEAVGVAEQHVEEAEETFRVVTQQFAEGMVLSAQVLDAELAHRTARARLARSLADYAVAHAALLNALGDVW